MKRNRPSAHWSIKLLVIFMVTLFFTISGIWLQQHIQRLIISDLGHDATSTAVAVARFLEQDLDAYRAFTDAVTDENSLYDATWYMETRNVLADIKMDTGADFIFTEKWVDENTIAYLLDAEIPGSGDYSAPGSQDGMSDPERRAFLESISLDSGMNRDPEWGDYLTGFSPIRDAETNRVLGLVGVDYSMAHVQNLLHVVRNVLVVGSLLIVLMTSLVLIWLIDSRYVALEIDYLTGLYSRHYHDRKMIQLQKNAEKTNVPYSHAIMDIDNFKHVNDHYSHQDGDEILKSVADILREYVQSSDCCARLGGDEFGLLFPDTTKDQAEMVLERIRGMVSRTAFTTSNGRQVNLTLSIGFVVWESGLDKASMEANADNAMYVSKNSGKNKVTCCPCPMTR